MSMNVLVQLGVGMATPFSILQVKKHLIRNMKQNADTGKSSQTGHHKGMEKKQVNLSPWKTRAQKDSLLR